jgi:hypothetical protein
MENDMEKLARVEVAQAPGRRPFSLVAKYAIGLTILPAVLGAGSCLFMVPGDLSAPIIIFAVIAPIVSIAAIIQVIRSKSRGLAAAITCFVFSLSFYIVTPILLIPRMKMLYSEMECGSRLKEIGYGLDVYQKERGGRYPDPNRWCDLLTEKADVSKKTFSLDEYKEGNSYVALNPACRPDSPPDTVLAFECKPGWNQHGGPELLDPNRHGGRGCLFLFRDMHVEFVKGREYQLELRWSGEGNARP